MLFRSKGSLKPKMNQVKGKPLKPGPGSLFETIERFMEFTDIGRIGCINITRRLLHVNLFLKVAMEKGIGHIKLLQRPTAADSNGKSQSNCGKFDNRTESLLSNQCQLVGETL